ncbi:embigin [Clarias gariepinus]|uniref:embigin n=1 Tax=Clarias gariepinus TaxID=13013 RepID=UPI00234C179F|nr:embigin [Clarias gariepinus]
MALLIQSQRMYRGSCSVNAIHLLLVLLYWHGVNTETTFSPGINKTIAYKGQSHEIKEHLEILKPQSIELLCSLTDVPSKSSNITGFWRKNGKKIENSTQTFYKNNEPYILKNIFNIQAIDLGNYSCVFTYLEIEEQVTFTLKVPAIKDKRDRPIVSYVGDSVVLECHMKPIPNTWVWYKTNGTEKELINATADPTHYKIFIDKNTTKLTAMKLTEEDSGNYTCSAVFDIKPTESHVELKVLSFTEPLKPFIAIAIEVVVLVTLILLYEKYSSKRKSHAGSTENGLYENAPTREENTMKDGETTTRQRKVEH